MFELALYALAKLLGKDRPARTHPNETPLTWGAKDPVIEGKGGFGSTSKSFAPVTPGSRPYRNVDTRGLTLASKPVSGIPIKPTTTPTTTTLNRTGLLRK